MSDKVKRIPSYGKNTEEERLKAHREWFENEWPTTRELIQNFLNSLPGKASLVFQPTSGTTTVLMCTSGLPLADSIGLLEWAKNDLCAGMVAHRLRDGR